MEGDDPTGRPSGTAGTSQGAWQDVRSPIRAVARRRAESTMYLEFFNLREFPFSIGCDGRFFFESEAHAEALANMLYTIQHRKGMVLVTGEVGTGKTFIGSMLSSHLGGAAQVVMVKHPPDSPKQLLRAVAEGMGARVSEADDKIKLVNQLERYLDRMHRRRKLVALILDEAQSLSDQTLEEIRFIWNWERDGQRLLQIVLIGQPELRERLRQPKWESFLQRIVLSYHLGGLSRQDTARYILHRRKAAALNSSPLRFTLRALEYIHAASGGVPRLVNILCDNALLRAYARNTTKITSGIVERAAREMTAWTRENPPPALSPGADEESEAPSESE